MTRATLIKARRGNEAAINQVLNYFNGSIFHQARRQVEPGTPFWDDYMQEGRLALLKALQNADLEREEGFYNYSANVIRSQMLKFSDQTKEIPWHHYTHVNQFLKLKSQLEAEKNREFTEEEVLDKMDKKPFEKQWIRDVLNRQKVMMEDEEGSTKWLEGEVLKGDLETLLDSRHLFLKYLMRILTPHQRKIVTRFYLDNRTADEIAEEMELNRQSVWTVLRLARGRMKKYWQLGFFLYAFDSDHFFDVQYTFPKESWKPDRKSVV